MTTDKNNAAPDLQPAELAERRGVALVTDAMVDAACKILHHGYDHESRKAYREACQKAARQALEAALAATGKQRVGEVQGDAVEHAKNLDLLRAGYHVDAEPRAAALNAAITALAARQPGVQTFQAGVSEWMGQCFLPSLYSNMTERGDRLLEEVLELLQAHGYDQGRVATLVDYVFGRPVGDPAQEVGGVMVTLAGYCWVAGLDMHAAGDAELRRITKPEVMAKIRRKQEAKNALHFDTPVPGNAAPPAQGIDLGQLRALAEKFESYGDDEIGDAFSSPYYQCATELRGLIDDQRDAAMGVGNG